MTQLSHKIVDIILSIPHGKVLSYGGVAALAGNPRAARQVSWLLKTQTEIYNLPWHRVISSKGLISIKDYTGNAIQQSLLESEGISFNGKGYIDLNKYMWNGLIETKKY